jgi:hypothetical protein
VITIDKDQFNNVIGSFGVDDIEQFYEDIIDAKMIYLYVFLSCFVVTLIYNIAIMVTGAVLIIASVLLNRYYD